MHRQAVNEIGNRAFLTASTNLEISNKPPADYLAKIEGAYPGALAAQFVPMDPSLWAVERYRDFIGARRELIARKLNEFMDSLISEPEPPRHRPIGDLIRLGESYVLEFKSTLQWDVIQGKQNNELRNSSLKTIAAFLNSQGGTLVIGVEDDGTIFGLEQDLKLLERSRDRFEQLLTRLVTDTIGVGIAPLYRPRFDAVDGKEVCIVDVERASEPVFLKTDRGKQFFVRVGNTSRALDHEEMLRYIETNWT
jgi:Putative DNA-binding domain